MPVQPGKFASDLEVTGLQRPISASTDGWRGMASVRLIIVESGSAGLGVHSAVDDAEARVVIAQTDGEPAGSFASRVVRLILALEQSRQNIARAVLFVGLRPDLDAAGARLTIARALITHSATARGQSAKLEIVLERPGEPGPGSAGDGELMRTAVETQGLRRGTSDLRGRHTS